MEFQLHAVFADRQNLRKYDSTLPLVVSDSIFLLDDALKKLQDMKEKDNIMADPAKWLVMTPQVSLMRRMGTHMWAETPLRAETPRLLPPHRMDTLWAEILPPQDPQ